ncbi:MAG: thiamine-phosphate kinase [Flavobacteriales bacterium]|nr:thiamine-phosphate kinase [Flavobacteriales bacterium]
MFENASLSMLDQLGEFGLIDRLTQKYSPGNKNLVQGIGDDSAIYVPGKDKLQVISTDLFIENVNFDLMYTPLKHLGYKVVVAGISDIYAMNAIPAYLTISMAISSKFSYEAIEELYSGVYLACEKYNIDLIGGDTGSSVKGLVLSVTVTGEVDPSKKVLRSGAEPNDLLCVSGDLGGAYMGLQLMEREKRVFMANPEMQPDLEGYDYIVGRQLKPEARKDVIELLDSLKILPTSMIDISDGLASEIMHLSNSSGVGFTIYEDKLPIDTQTISMASEFNLDATMCVLNGGEDYELLFTIHQKDFKAIENLMDISVIGHATENKKVCEIVTATGSTFQLKAQGWESQE